MADEVKPSPLQIKCGCRPMQPMPDDLHTHQRPQSLLHRECGSPSSSLSGTTVSQDVIFNCMGSLNRETWRLTKAKLYLTNPNNMTKPLSPVSQALTLTSLVTKGREWKGGGGGVSGGGRRGGHYDPDRNARHPPTLSQTIHQSDLPFKHSSVKWTWPRTPRDRHSNHPLQRCRGQPGVWRKREGGRCSRAGSPGSLSARNPTALRGRQQEWIPTRLQTDLQDTRGPWRDLIRVFWHGFGLSRHQGWTWPRSEPLDSVIGPDVPCYA